MRDACVCVFVCAVRVCRSCVCVVQVQASAQVAHAEAEAEADVLEIDKEAGAAEKLQQVSRIIGGELRALQSTLDLVNEMDAKLEGVEDSLLLEGAAGGDMETVAVGVDGSV